MTQMGHIAVRRRPRSLVGPVRISLRRKQGQGTSTSLHRRRTILAGRKITHASTATGGRNAGSLLQAGMLHTSHLCLIAGYCCCRCRWPCSSSSDSRCSGTGTGAWCVGVVARGGCYSARIPSLFFRFMFSDFCTDEYLSAVLFFSFVTGEYFWCFAKFVQSGLSTNGEPGRRLPPQI